VLETKYCPQPDLNNDEGKRDTLYTCETPSMAKRREATYG